MRNTAIFTAAFLLALARAGWAQPVEPAQGAPVPPPAEDSIDVIDIYDGAFRALLAGDFDAAIRGFGVAHARSVVPERRAAAAELQRLARELQARGAKISLRVAAPGAPEKPATADEDPDAGRTTFIAATTMSAFYSGFVLIDLLDIEDFRPGVLVVTGTTAAGFVGSLYGSRGRTITAGMGDAYSLGLGLGVGNGLLLGVPLGLDDDREQYLSFALGALAVGGAAGMYIGARSRPTQAQVSVVGTLSMMGIATTGLGLGILQPDSLDADDFLLIMAGGLDAGAAAGLLMAPKLDWSLSRARLVSLGVFLGGLAGWASAALITGADEASDEDTARFWSAATLGGMWGGLALTSYVTRNMQPDRRYRADKATPPKRDAVVMPTVIRDAPGFAVAGYF